MSHDPVTESMLPRGFNDALKHSAEKTDKPPAIDLSALDQYPLDAVKQCLLDTRIKLSRINEEINQNHKIMEAARADMNICLGRSRFYQIVRNILIRYIKEKEECNQPSENTPPSQN
jgi:hypothetical protein